MAVIALAVAAAVLVGLVWLMVRISDQPSDDYPPADEVRMWAEIRAALNRPNKETL